MLSHGGNVITTLLPILGHMIKKENFLYEVVEINFFCLVTYKLVQKFGKIEYSSHFKIIIPNFVVCFLCCNVAIPTNHTIECLNTL